MLNNLDDGELPPFLCIHSRGSLPVANVCVCVCVRARVFQHALETWNFTPAWSVSALQLHAL